jgi:hypothetical protein
MYKFVNTLTDSTPWINHFKKQANSTSVWRATPDKNVGVLKEDVSREGVEDPTKLQTVNPIEQVSDQAKASLEKEVAEETLSQPKSSKKNVKRKPKSIKKKVGALTKQTKDIFSEDFVKKKKKK